mgnify:CR=1 FL=1
MIILKTIIEDLFLSVLFFLICAIGIRKSAIGMVHLYSQKVQNCCVELGLITHNKIKRYSILFKIICIPGLYYICFTLRIFDKLFQKIS